MNTLNEMELSDIEGGTPLLGIAAGAYMALLNKIEANPNSYTWTMDWYYAE